MKTDKRTSTAPAYLKAIELGTTVAAVVLATGKSEQTVVNMYQREVKVKIDDESFRLSYANRPTFIILCKAVAAGIDGV